ncbi:hypothetical protein VUR80DRAFT_644 [Thermomyces stellatus]
MASTTTSTSLSMSPKQKSRAFNRAHLHCHKQIDACLTCLRNSGLPSRDAPGDDIQCLLATGYTQCCKRCLLVGYRQTALPSPFEPPACQASVISTEVCPGCPEVEWPGRRILRITLTLRSILGATCVVPWPPSWDESLAAEPLPDFTGKEPVLEWAGHQRVPLSPQAATELHERLCIRAALGRIGGIIDCLAPPALRFCTVGVCTSRYATGACSGRPSEPRPGAVALKGPVPRSQKRLRHGPISGVPPSWPVTATDWPI